MQRKLYIHVGPPKTGSSALQNYFSNQTNMGEHICYPNTGRWIDDSHNSLVFSYRGIKKYGDNDISEWDVLINSLDKEISESNSDKNLVLSSESIFPEFIEKLGWLFRKHNLEVIILFVLRDSIDRAASYYNQQVKDPAIGLKQLPDIFLKNSAELFRLRPIIESFKSLEYKLVYIRYKASEPIIKRFCDILGTKYNAQYEQTVNRSMNSKGLLTMLIVNLITNSESKRRQILNNMLTDSSYEIWKGAAFPFSKNSCKQFSEFLEEDYAWVLDNTGILLTPSNFQKFTINTKEKFEIVSKLLVYKVLNKSNSKQIESLLENFL